MRLSRACQLTIARFELRGEVADGVAHVGGVQQLVPRPRFLACLHVPADPEVSQAAANEFEAMLLLGARRAGRARFQPSAPGSL
jgi:hypothetical protein